MAAVKEKVKYNLFSDGAIFKQKGCHYSPTVFKQCQGQIKQNVWFMLHPEKIGSVGRILYFLLKTFFLEYLDVIKYSKTKQI